MLKISTIIALLWCSLWIDGSGHATELSDDQQEPVAIKPQRNYSYGNFDNLPAEIISHILSFCDNPNIIRTNAAFFTLITGYNDDQIMLKGPYTPPPNPQVRLHRKVMKEINFSAFADTDEIVVEDKSWKGWIKRKVTKASSWLPWKKSQKKYDIKEFEHMSSYIWYCLLEDIYYLPQQYWPNFQSTNIYLLALDSYLNDDIEKLGQCIMNTSIQCLTLLDDNIDDDKIKLFWPFINKSNLRGLSLAYNQITDVGFDYIVQNLKYTKLITIDLEHNHIKTFIKENMIQDLVDSNTTRLRLNDNEIDDEGVQNVRQLFEAMAKTDRHYFNLALHNNLVSSQKADETNTIVQQYIYELNKDESL